MEKKKSVFLFGAGATLAWSAPSTSELTNEIRNSGFKTTDNETYITEYIFQKLLENGFTEQEANFETILAVIEELVGFSSYFNGDNHTPSIASCFLKSTYHEKIFNYSIQGGRTKHGDRLQIHRGVDYNFSKNSIYNEHPDQFFLMHLISDLLTYIVAQVSKYSYHTAGKRLEKLNSEESLLFKSWMAGLNTTDSLRLYTLNYDRLFKILMENVGICVFEGFEAGETIAAEHYIKPDLKRILTDENCNVHYNLHGSAFWHFESLNSNQLPLPEIYLTGAPKFASNNQPICLQLEKGRSILHTNIVSGFQKASKTLLSPLRQMNSAFDKDLLFGDHLYIIGYSFGDEHINESIRTAFRYNDKFRLTIVDPSFTKNGNDVNALIRVFGVIENVEVNPILISDDHHQYYSGRITIFTMTFIDFLKKQLGEN